MNTASNYDAKIKKRVQLVHIAAAELGLLDPKKHETDPDDQYHMILRRWNRPGTRQPVTSSLQMNYAQLGELLDFFKTLGFKLKKSVRSSEFVVRSKDNPSPQPSQWKKYESSLAGLKLEIRDLAKARWPDTWSSSLNALCRKFGVDHYNFLNVNHAKAVKSWFQKNHDSS